MSTILHRLAAWAESDPTSPAQTYKVGDRWKSRNSREFCDRVYWLALFLESRGMGSKDIGSIFSYNCPEWVQMDLAPLLLGAMSTGIYPNSTPKDILYILNHTESRFFAVQNKEYFKRIVGDQGESGLPSRIELILVFDGDESISPKAVSFEKAIEEGKRRASQSGAKSLSQYLKLMDPNAGAFMIYTSGTTGHPKGAILSHDNLVFTVDRVAEHWKLKMGKGRTLFSFLPLCHVAEKLQNVGAGISLRYNVYYCTQFESVGQELPEAQPRLLLCVPRVWEKMMEGVQKKLDHSSFLRKQLAHWALSVGGRVAESRMAHQTPQLKDWLQWQVADRVLLSKIRHALGLALAETTASGAAVLSPSVCKWFRAIGVEINEAYGQTESTAVICMTQRGEDCIGTVGTAVQGLEVKLAEDGEILTRGRHVFKGYFKDDVGTAQVLEGGWLHTGDLGEYDARKMIRIRGRKKEILKTSGGKMVAPLPIEEALKCVPMISQVCMVGDGRKYLSALITLSESKLAELSQSNGALKGNVITTPQVVNEVKQHVDQLNEGLASYEQIKKFAILAREFSIAEGEMTPTLKMKRNVIESRYQQLIEKFYAS